MSDITPDAIKWAIRKNLITFIEWNRRFRYFNDNIDGSNSFVHYMIALQSGLVTCFVTLPGLMTKHREELEKRFKLKIRTPEELIKEHEKENKNK